LTFGSMLAMPMSKKRNNI